MVNLEERIKMLLSVRRKLEAQKAFYDVQRSLSPETITQEMEAYHTRVTSLMEGCDGILQIIPEEDAAILELRLIKGLKWQFVIADYERKRPAEAGTHPRTYMNRQQYAIRRIAKHLTAYSDRFDFSWLFDPLVDELYRSDLTDEG